MANSNKKIIGGTRASSGSTEKTISGNGPTLTVNENTPPDDKKIVGSSRKKTPVFDADLDVKGKLRNATLQGGLTAVPDDFDSPKGSWETIKSDDAFEVLYLDYTEYKKITDKMVINNHSILSTFWNGIKTLNNRPRQNALKKYGEELITVACDHLDKAKKKIGTPAGRETYFRENTEKRINKGIQAIAQLIELGLVDGECTRERGMLIIERGKENGLHEDEVRSHLMYTLNAKGFSPKPGLNSPDFLNNEWMTHAAREIKDVKSIPDIYVLDEKVTSLKNLGQVLYQHAATAKTEYLHNPNYIIADISKLEHSRKALEYEKLINAEPDIDKRFLKVVYHLNPTLPYEIYNQSFTSISELFQKTATDHGLFVGASNEYQKGHLQIWLQETDSANAAKLPTGFNYNSFLNFVFTINSDHGMYLGQEKFNTPEQLIAKAKTDKTYWYKISEAMQADVLPAWLAGIGRQEWLSRYNTSLQQIVDNNLYEEEEKKLVAVQTLIQIIDESVANPVISVAPEVIKLLALEGNEIVRKKIQLSLSNFGFEKANIVLQTTIAGIQLTTNDAVLFSLGESTATDIYLEIDPLKLLKDTTYILKIAVQTTSQNITIPVAIKVVFPRRAYYLSMAKYAGWGALLFGIIRLLIGEIAQTGNWLSTINRVRSNTYHSLLPDNPGSYFLVIALLIGSLAGAILLIKKIEKL